MIENSDLLPNIKGGRFGPACSSRACFILSLLSCSCLKVSACLSSVSYALLQGRVVQTGLLNVIISAVAGRFVSIGVGCKLSTAR